MISHNFLKYMEVDEFGARRKNFHIILWYDEDYKLLKMIADQITRRFLDMLILLREKLMPISLSTPLTTRRLGLPKFISRSQDMALKMTTTYDLASQEKGSHLQSRKNMWHINIMIATCDFCQESILGRCHTKKTSYFKPSLTATTMKSSTFSNYLPICLSTWTLQTWPLLWICSNMA